MLIGIYWGYVAMLEGLVDRMKQELDRPVKVVATGGLADLFDKHTRVFDAIEPDLTIQGLGLLYDMSSSPSQMGRGTVRRTGEG
jgi:type III pantothenate kinase